MAACLFNHLISCLPSLPRPPAARCPPSAAGFYPGYYLTFATAAAVAPVEKMFAARIRPRIEGLGKPAAVAYDIATRVGTHCIMNYSVLPFVVSRRVGIAVPST